MKEFPLSNNFKEVWASDKDNANKIMDWSELGFLILVLASIIIITLFQNRKAANKQKAEE